MRLIDAANYSLIDSNKLMQVVDRVMFIYEKETINRGTQMIFSDVGTPANTEFSVYRELKTLFMERGVPEEEIAFIHDAKNKDQKLQLQRKMNAGEIRILIASTEKGGTGLNVQKRLKAVHHLDIPWKPSDLIQRNGRCERQGNAYSQIFIYYYITKGSFDNYQFQIIESKLKFIMTLWSGDNATRTADDIDEQTLTASDFKAIATGNPYLKMKMELENELGLLNNRKKAWERDKENSKRRVENAHTQIAHLKEKLANIDDDVAQALATKPYTEEVLDSEGKTTTITHNAFSMSFESGFTTDKRDLAGNQLHFDLQGLVSEKPEMRTLASYRGFKLRAITQQSMWHKGRILTINIVGKNSYPVEIDFESPMGSIQRINNTINGIEKMRDKINSTISSYQVVISKGLPSDIFEHQSRLGYVKSKFEVIQPLVDKNEHSSVIMKAVQEFESDYNFDNNILEEKKETQSSLEIFSPGFDYELEVIIETDAHNLTIEENDTEQQEILAVADFLAEAQEMLELFSGHTTKIISDEVVEVVQTSLFDELF